MISVLLADDTAIARAGLKMMLRIAKDITVVDEATTTIETESLVLAKRPDIVILDLKWFGNGEAGQNTIRRIKALAPKTKIIALTNFEVLLADAQLAGADVAVAKTAVNGDNLVKMIRDLHQQQTIPDLPTREDILLLSPLSDRELEVLKLLKKGYTNPEIGLALNITVNTVKNHVGNIFSKLNVKSRTQAAEAARNAGL